MAIVLKEKYGSTNIENTYSKIKSEKKVIRVKTDRRQTSFLNFLSNFFREAFLPQGYPNSVSGDYLEYQLFDTLQAFCSQITGTLTTKAILQSIGVGNAEATPIAAAISWIFKDGTGRFGSIIFAWMKGVEFDSDCKKWRLFADILNDSAMFIEMLLPYLQSYTTALLCLTTAMKAGVGVSGSATRAAITQHQAKNNNMADVSAKDGSQETAVNLFASIFSLMILTIFPQERFDWILFIVFTVLHLLANYCAVKCLKFNTLNEARYKILLKEYFKNEIILDPDVTNKKENVIIGLGESDVSFCGFKIHIGRSVLKLNSFNFEDYLNLYKKESYIIVPDITDHNVDILLRNNVTSEDIIIAYYNATFLAVAISKVFKNKDFKYIAFMDSKINDEIEDIKKDDAIEKIFEIAKIVKNNLTKNVLLEKLNKSGWKIERHAMKIEDWRIETEIV